MTFNNLRGQVAVMEWRRCAAWSVVSFGYFERSMARLLVHHPREELPWRRRFGRWWTLKQLSFLFSPLLSSPILSYPLLSSPILSYPLLSLSETNHKEKEPGKKNKWLRWTLFQFSFYANTKIQYHQSKSQTSRSTSTGSQLPCIGTVTRDRSTAALARRCRQLIGVHFPPRSLPRFWLSGT